MCRLSLSGTGKLLGQMGNCGVILCEVPQPEVQLALDGCVMVMKRDEMNSILGGGKCLSHTQCSQERPYGITTEMLARDKHHLS